MSHKGSTSAAPTTITLSILIFLCTISLQVARSGDPRSHSGYEAVQDRLDPNTADWFELAQLPGIGPSMAERITDVRRAGRSFATLPDMRSIRGIGPKTLTKLEPFLRFGAPASVTLTGNKPVDTVSSALSPLESGG